MPGPHGAVAAPLAGPGNSGYLSLRNDFGLDPSTAVATLTPAIQAAITAAIAAGKGLDVGADLWPINAALLVTGSLAIRGSGAEEVFDTVNHSIKTCVPGAAPWVKGGGFVQQTAATNIIEATGSGNVLHLHDLVLSFATAIAFNNTGHAVYCVPTAVQSAKPDNGLVGCRWDNVIVFGHDGNHYAFYMVNMNLFTATHLRSFGGGGWYQEVNSAVSPYGNGTITQPYFAVFCAGTADGFHLETKSGLGNVGLLTFIRPQANMVDTTTSPLGNAFTITSPPSTVNQQQWREVGASAQVLLISPDFEPSTYSITLAPLTSVIGPELSPRSQWGNTILGRAALPGTGQSSATNNTAIGAAAIGANTTGASNTAVGASALQANTTGANNTAIGYQALKANTTATSNTAIGANALLANTTGTQNTAIGLSAAAAATTANNNTAIGYSALASTTTGGNNTAIGRTALNANVTGTNNTAIGSDCLKAATGDENVAVGYQAALVLTTGADNVAVGLLALGANTTGSNNVAVGVQALKGATGSTGSQNTGVGQNAGAVISTGTKNTAIGANAGAAITTGGSNVAVGYDALGNVTTGTNNVGLGLSAGNWDGTTTTLNSGTNMTLLGWQAQATVSNVIVLGSAITANRPNLAFGQAGVAGAFGGGVGVFHIANAATNPSTNPTGGGIIYVDAGALKYRGSSGTVTTLGVA